MERAVAWDFFLLQALLVENSVLLLAISEHPLVKAATVKIIKQKLKILVCLCAFIPIQKLQLLVTCFFT